MIRLLKRLIGPAANPSRLAARNRGSAESSLPVVGEPIPVPEVVEGDGGESDWNLWEDSVLSSDSQLQALAPAGANHDKTQPLSRDELNGYANSRSSGRN